jgi:hypothetical protein
MITKNKTVTYVDFNKYLGIIISFLHYHLIGVYMVKRILFTLLVKR